MKAIRYKDNTGKLLMAITNILNVQPRKDSEVRILRGDERGAAIWYDDDIYLVFDDSDPMEERYFTVAHELGHILLEHNLRIGDRRYFERQHICEYEADVFARGLLKLIENAKSFSIKEEVNPCHADTQH